MIVPKQTKSCTKKPCMPQIKCLHKILKEMILTGLPCSNGINRLPHQKLTICCRADVNLINILQSAFSFKSVLHSYSVVKVFPLVKCW